MVSEPGPDGRGGDSHDELPREPDVPDQSVGSRAPHLSAASMVLVLVGGVAGTAVRYGFEVVAPARPGHWPVGTFVANLAGAFVLGLLLELLASVGSDHGWRRSARLLLGTGFCGGLTTYSALAVETDLLVRDHSGGLAIVYLLVTIVAGLIATVAGVASAARLRPRSTDRDTT